MLAIKNLRNKLISEQHLGFSRNIDISQWFETTRLLADGNNKYGWKHVLNDDFVETRTRQRSPRGVLDFYLTLSLKY